MLYTKHVRIFIEQLNMEKLVELAEKFMKLMEWIIVLIASFAMVLLTIIVFGEVLSRYVFKIPFVFTTEITALLFPWMVFLGAVAVQIDNSHLSITFLKETLPTKIKHFLSYFEKLVMLFFSIYMLISAQNLTQILSAQNLRTIDISRAWPYYSMVIAFLLMSIVLILQVFIMAFGSKDKEQTH
jgi:TRAP-type C4-dicarboxylate transport system permease small subunit